MKKIVLSIVSMVLVGALDASAATRKLVAECSDSSIGLAYQVFQTDSSGLRFEAQNVRTGSKIKGVHLVLINHGIIIWQTDISFPHAFQLVVNRLDVNEKGADALLTTETFHGHLRCPKIFPEGTTGADRI